MQDRTQDSKEPLLTTTNEFLDLISNNNVYDKLRQFIIDRGFSIENRLSTNEFLDLVPNVEACQAFRKSIISREIPFEELTDEQCVMIQNIFLRDLVEMLKKAIYQPVYQKLKHKIYSQLTLMDLYKKFEDEVEGSNNFLSHVRKNESKNVECNKLVDKVLFKFKNINYMNLLSKVKKYKPSLYYCKVDYSMTKKYAENTKNPAILENFIKRNLYKK